MDKSIIQIENVAIGYVYKKLCSDINTNVLAGSFVLFLGANGKGKSTLLKTIAGFTPPLHGDIQINGKSISAYTLKELATLVSFLPASSQMVEGLSVLELLSFSRIPFKTWFQNTNDADIKFIFQVAADVGIHELLDQKFETLSDGQKQKVNIARCLVQETPIILLDEPTAHLDIVNKIQIFELIRQLTLDGKTIICTTHDVRDACNYASHFWMIDNENHFISSENNSNVVVEDMIAKMF